MSEGISSVGGTGSNAIETAFIQRYKDGFEQQFQQFNTTIANYFEIVSQASEYDYYDRIGLAEELVEVTTRYHDNPVSEIPHDRRRIGLRDFEQGKMIEPKDLIRLSSDPTNAYTMALKAAAHRKMDDIVLERIFDVAYVGKKGEASVSFVSTNSGKITVGNLSKGTSRPITTAGDYVLQAGDSEGIDIAVDYVESDEDAGGGAGVATAQGITLGKLRAARRTFERLEAVGDGEILDCWITSDQAAQLLKIPEVINLDYTTRAALQEGKAVSFMGFRFLRCERLKGSGTAADPRQCIIAKKQAMKVAYSKNLTFDMWKLPGKRNIPYMYLSLGMDAVRMWGECTLRLNCLDAL